MRRRRRGARSTPPRSFACPVRIQGPRTSRRRRTPRPPRRYRKCARRRFRRFQHPRRPCPHGPPHGGIPPQPPERLRSELSRTRFPGRYRAFHRWRLRFPHDRRRLRRLHRHHAPSGRYATLPATDCERLPSPLRRHPATLSLPSVRRRRRRTGLAPMPRWLNFANSLTVLRLLLVPAILHAILTGQHRLALALFLLAAFTDIADGAAARRWGHATAAGAYLDPIADKCLMSGVYLALAAARLVPWWFVALVLGRDLYILAGEAAPTPWLRFLASAMLWPTAAITLLSGVHYTWKGFLIVRKH